MNRARKVVLSLALIPFLTILVTVHLTAASLLPAGTNAGAPVGGQIVFAAHSSSISAE
jgi:hypothetical protein